MQTDTITRNPSCNTGGPNVGTVVTSLVKLAEDATTITYSIISVDSGPLNDPYCFPDLWAPPPYDHQTFPGTSADWVWSKTSNVWTTGGWGDGTQFTGTYNQPPGNPYADTTTTVS
jgi:hypothetical protein